MKKYKIYDKFDKKNGGRCLIFGKEYRTLWITVTSMSARTDVKKERVR